MIIDFKDKKILILGGTKGIGLAVSELFLESKGQVHIVSRNQNFEVEKKLIRKYGNKVFFYYKDVTKKKEVENLKLEFVKNSNGILNCLVSNVGDGTPNNFFDSAEWEKSWSTNFNSGLFSSKIFYELLKKNKGSLLFTSSIAGLEYIGAPIVYSVAKSALISLSKSLSHNYAPEVRVNVVLPGNINFKGSTWEKKKNENPIKVEKMLEEKVPLKRFGKPKEVAELILFLSSKKASFITGGCFVIDGGQTTTF